MRIEAHEGGKGVEVSFQSRPYLWGQMNAMVRLCASLLFLSLCLPLLPAPSHPAFLGTYLSPAKHYIHT